MSQERVKASGVVDKFAKEVMKAYDLNGSGKTSTTKEIYFLFLSELLDLRLIIDEEKGKV